MSTNVVTAIEIHEKNAADVRQLPALVQTTARNFAVAEVSADKAYGSRQNAEVIANLGAMPYIALKGNAVGTGYGAWIAKNSSPTTTSAATSRRPSA